MKNFYKADFHTHSILSEDGGISEKDYEDILEKQIIDYIAITDHNQIDFAIKMNKKLGEKIIVGEEISAREGHVIGLFLKKIIEPYLGIAKTIELIKEQGGFVYIPHPFDVFRNGVGKVNLDLVINNIDIIESFNSKVIIPSFNTKAKNYAFQNNILEATGSDSHSKSALGRTFTQFPGKITKKNILSLLKEASFSKKYSLLNYLDPNVNRLKKIIK